MSFHVESDPRISAAVLSWKAAAKDVQKITRSETVNEFRPVWQEAVRRRASRYERRTLAQLLRNGVTFGGGNPPEARAFTTVKRLTGGATPAETGPRVEFGAGNPQLVTRYRRKSPKGGSHTVSRRASVQLGRRIKAGRTVYPSVAEIAPRVVAFWTASIIRRYADPEAVADRGI